MNEGKFLADALDITFQCTMRSMMNIAKLESNIEEFHPQISETIASIFTTFLENAKSAAQTSFDTTTLLTKEIDLSKAIKEVMEIDRSDPDAISKSVDVMADYYEYGLFIAASFIESATLHNLLAAIVDEPNPTVVDYAKQFANVGLSYLAEVGMEAIPLVSNVKKAMEVTETLKESLNQLHKSKMVLTLQSTVDFERNIEFYSKTAQSIAELSGIQKDLYQEAMKFAERLSGDTNG